MFSNWKTSLIGIGGGILIALGTYLQTGNVSVEGALGAIGLAILGIFTGDARK